MKALVYTAPFSLALADIPEPVPGPLDVLVRVKAVGICGSDVQGYTGETGRRIPPLPIFTIWRLNLKVGNNRSYLFRELVRDEPPL